MLNELFDGELSQISNYLISKFISPSVFIDIQIYSAGMKLQDIDIDWSNMKLSAKNPSDKLVSTLAIYIDLEYLNSIIANQDSVIFPEIHLKKSISTIDSVLHPNCTMGFILPKNVYKKSNQETTININGHEINKKFFNGENKIEIVLNKDVVDLLNKTENDIINEDRSVDDGEIYNYD